MFSKLHLKNMNTTELKGNWNEQNSNTKQEFDNPAAPKSPIYCLARTPISNAATYDNRFIEKQNQRIFTPYL
jgi:hypothetical protein